MAADDVMIELEGIRFAYPRWPVLFEDFALTIRRNERLGVVGANGSGKTTLFHLIVGLVKPTSGRLCVLGRPIETNSDYAFARQKAGLLFQDSEDQLFCPTVLEDVAFGPLNLGVPKEQVKSRVEETLAALGLSGYERRLNHQLSGGEKRLVALATVLAMRPEVLLLDEPANGLDPQARRELLTLLARIGSTQVIASHDLEFVRSTCTRVVVIDRGQLLADGPTDDVLADSELMLTHGLEVPFSLDSQHGLMPLHDHRHGAGPSHGHGHAPSHELAEHERESGRDRSLEQPPPGES